MFAVLVQYIHTQDLINCYCFEASQAYTARTGV